MKKVVQRLYIIAGMEILAVILSLIAFAVPWMLAFAVLIGVPPAGLVLQSVNRFFAGLVLVEIGLLIIFKHNTSPLLTGTFAFLMMAFCLGVLFLIYQALKQEHEDEAKGKL